MSEEINPIIPDPVRDILQSAETASEALRRIIEVRRRDDRRRSLAFYCRATGIGSTGYLSDILSGRRKLKPEYRQPLLKALKLKGPSRRCLRLLMEIETAKDSASLALLTRKLNLTRKALKSEYLPLTDALSNLTFAFEVFCTFGLFAGTPRREDLVRYFGAKRTADVDLALSGLAALGVIEAADGRYRILNAQVFFNGSAGLSHIDFLKMAIDQARASVEAWFPQKNRALFISSTISVRTADYRHKLAALRSRLRMAQVEMEAGEADELIHFNVQIYPVRPPS